MLPHFKQQNEGLKTFFEFNNYRENIKKNCVGAWLEKESPSWADPDVTKRAYHRMTRGWILNEIVRRVDPEGRTMGEIFFQEVTSKARPL